jgi:tetratricopeptide (TPR) repeat protein
LPNLTFQDSLHLYFNNEEIGIFYLPGHTNHDIIIHFKNAKVICVGDLIIPDSFGSISQTGHINLLKKALDYLCNHFPDDITFVAGHERTLTKKDLLNYKKMLDETSDIILNEIKKGKDPEEIIKSDVLKDWTNWNSVSAPILNTNTWTMWIYKNLTTKISAAAEVETILKTSDYKNAKAKIEQVLNKKDKYYTIETELNTLGYTLMNEGKTNDALAIFKMIVDRYPESWNAYDSLGEAYMNSGDKEQSIKHYEKSLELNSKNTNAIGQLKKLK